MSSNVEIDAIDAAREPPVSMEKFLESIPPGVTKRLDCNPMKEHEFFWMFSSWLDFYCPRSACQGVRRFEVFNGDSKQFLKLGWLHEGTLVITYRCRNCKSQLKAFVVDVKANPANVDECEIVKRVEWPPFGNPLPSRISKLVGEDRELFFKGRRSEENCLGIGAFAYYRRVIEDQRTRFLTKIVEVARRLGKTEVIATLEAAKEETQFKKSLEMVKDAIPDALKIDGHNPMTLLHRAYSEGLHAKTDEECLASAKAVQVVLVELAERIDQALKDDTDLKAAVSRLVNRT